MNLFLNSVLHIATSLSLVGTPQTLTFIEYGVPTTCALQSIGWDGSAWQAQASACTSDRVFRDDFDPQPSA